tara:strand:+ start:67 stop:822 length:756 start_codon:yes stop_codon:yes gene_type:complete
MIKMFAKKPKIKFYGSDLLDVDLAAPRSANKFTPDWFKKMPSFLDVSGNKKTTSALTEGGIVGNATIKKCVPVLDAFGFGYIIPMPFDCLITKRADGLEFGWRFEGCVGLDGFLSSHSEEQVKGCPMSSGSNDKMFYKVQNPWHIETPTGYSCLITAPLNRKELPIQILSGVVDTDHYHTVNFPFILNLDEGEHLIKAGTPIAQVIPFKREKWESKNEILTEERVGRGKAVIDTFLHEFYKRKHHVKKSFL